MNPDDGCKKVPFHVGSTTCPGETHSQYTGQSPPSAVKQKRWEIYTTLHHLSLTKKPTIRDTTTGFLACVQTSPISFVARKGNRRRLHAGNWFPREMASERQAQKFHTDNASLSGSG